MKPPKIKKQLPKIKKKQSKRFWIDIIEYTDGLYHWQVVLGAVPQKAGIAFTLEEAHREIAEARQILGA